MSFQIVSGQCPYCDGDGLFVQSPEVIQQYGIPLCWNLRFRCRRCQGEWWMMNQPVMLAEVPDA